MTKDYLNPKQPIAIEPAGDVNVAAVGPCCLDINTKTTSLAKGRGSGVWWTIWIAIAFSAPGVPFAFYTGDILGGFLISLAVVGIYSLATLRLIYAWRNYYPMRFNRRTRKVYFYHKGKTYISEWDTLRAYFKLQRGVAYGGALVEDDQLNIEFQNEAGKTITVFLMGTQKAGLRWMEGPVALWEYIRIYMEEGPEGLAPPKNWIPDATSLEEVSAYFNPFPIHADYWWSWPFEIALFFPFRFAFFLVAYPTDLIYFHLASRIQVKPFPPELAEPCVCEETEQAREQRISEVLSFYDERIDGNIEELALLQQSLPTLYHEWFAEFRFPGSLGLKALDTVPEGWQRVRLIDIVELNPTYHGVAGQEHWFIPADALPEEGFFLERSRLERQTTRQGSNMCRNDDTLFPGAAPWLEDAQPAFVHSLDDNELAACSGELIVMRGLNISPAFVHCLAGSRALREYAKDHMVDTPEGPRVSLDALANFTMLMPPVMWFKAFDNSYAQPYLKRAVDVAVGSVWLRRGKERLVANLHHREAVPEIGWFGK